MKATVNFREDRFYQTFLKDLSSLIDSVEN